MDTYVLSYNEVIVTKLNDGNVIKQESRYMFSEVDGNISKLPVSNTKVTNYSIKREVSRFYIERILGLDDFEILQITVKIDGKAEEFVLSTNLAELSNTIIWAVKIGSGINQSKLKELIKKIELKFAEIDIKKKPQYGISKSRKSLFFKELKQIEEIYNEIDSENEMDDSKWKEADYLYMKPDYFKEELEESGLLQHMSIKEIKTIFRNERLSKNNSGRLDYTHSKHGKVIGINVKKLAKYIEDNA